jgi:predicted RNA-binding protein YlxR (DUF448 family)
VKEVGSVAAIVTDDDELVGLGGHAERTCVGCREPAPRSALLRLCHVPELPGGFVPDLGGKLGGRGVWLHFRGACLQKAVRSGFSRALRQQVRADAALLTEQTRTQIDRRIHGLLLAVMRRHKVALGTDAVISALAACTPRILLVAKDAAGRRDDVVALATEREVPVLTLFDKDRLGHLTGKAALSFIAVLDDQIAREIAESARWLAGLSEDG